MNKFCLYSDTCLSAPCFSIQMFKYSYLPDFLEDKKKYTCPKQYSIPLKIECVKPKANEGFEVQESRCINCMFCVFGCTGNRIRINKTIHPEEFCYDITKEELRSLQDDFLVKLFNGEFVKLPKVPLSQIKVKYRSFKEFTSVDETTNIAVWTANAMKFLSTSLEPRVALEVGVDITDRDRNGRLDVTLYNIKDNFLFVAEAKVSFEAMMADMRFEAQLLGYESELRKNSKDGLMMCKFLVIGGDEMDLLPSNDSRCKSRNKSLEFYDILKKRNFFFISANAMLALGLMKMFVSQNNYSLENIYKVITDDRYLGLLSCGVVTREGNISTFDDIPDFFIYA